MEIARSEKILKALANSKRLAILKNLEKVEGLDIASLAKQINLHYKSTAKHLDKLASAGLAKKTRRGLFVKVSFDPDLKKLMELINNLDRRRT